MRKNSVKIVFIFILFIGKQIWAITLEQVIDLAIKNAPEYQASLEQFNATKELLPLAKSQMSWQAEISAKQQYQYNDYTDLHSRDTISGLSMNKFLFNAPYSANISKAELEIEKSRLSLELSKQRMLVEVSKLFYKIAQLIESIEVMRFEEDVIKEQYEKAKLLHSIQLATEIDFIKAKTKLDLTYVKLLDLEIELNQAKDDLSNITGLNSNNIDIDLNFKKTLKIFVNQNNQDSYLSSFTENLDYKIAQFDYHIAKLNYQAKKKEGYPTVQINFGYDINQDRVSDTRYDTKSSSLAISWKFATGGRVSSQQRKSLAELKATEANLSNQEKKSKALVSKSYAEVVSDIKRLSSRESAVFSANESFKAVKKGLELGSATQDEMLSALFDKSSAEHELSKSKFQQIIHLLEYKASIGLLSVEDFKF